MMTNAYDRNDQMIRGEVAAEILNNARGLLTERIHTIADAQPEEAERLRGIRKSLTELQQDIDFQKPGEVEEIIQSWGLLLKDKALFWERINAR